MSEIVLYGKGKGGKGLDDPNRKLARRTIDFGSNAIRWLEDCLNPWEPYGRLQCHYSYTKELMPPFATPQSPYDAICPRFVHSSTTKNRAPVNVVHWFPNGRRVMSGTQSGEMTIWNGFQFHHENIMQAHNASVKAMQWNHEETVLVSGDQLGIIKFWDQYVYNFQSFQAHKESICDLAIAPTGLKFVSCADDSHAKVWDLRTGEEERAFTGHGWDVKCCSWHPTKGLVATGSKDAQIKLWDPRASEAVTTIYCHNNTVTKVAWSPNGQNLVSGSRDHLMMLMDIRTMSVRKVFRGHEKEVTSLCWHPEAEAVLASGDYGGTMNFWDTLGACSPLTSVKDAHEGPIWSLSWHPLGHLLVSGSNDYSTRFWSRARPGDTNFQDMLPKKVGLSEGDPVPPAPPAVSAQEVFSSGIFADLPGPLLAIEAKAIEPEPEKLAIELEPVKHLPGLSIGEGENRMDVLNTADFDEEEDEGAAEALQPGEGQAAKRPADAEAEESAAKKAKTDAGEAQAA